MPSSCWKHPHTKVHLVVGKDTNTVAPPQVTIDRLVHFSGNLDIALLSISEDSLNRIDSNDHFPCILSTDGWKEVHRSQTTGILELSQAGTFARTMKVKHRGLPVNLMSSGSCPEQHVCYAGEEKRFARQADTMQETEMPIFFKLNSHEWAVAGLTGETLRPGRGIVLPLHPTIKWIDETIFA